MKAGGAVVHEATVLESVQYLNTTSSSNPWRAGEETETDVTHPAQYQGEERLDPNNPEGRAGR